MTLQPLTKLGIGPNSKPTPGKPPALDYLPLALLLVNTSYQRPITRGGLNTIGRIVDAFSWSRFSPVIVRHVPGKGLYEIIDGQHRCTAALALGYDRVPCMIVHASDEEAARIFATVNGNVTPMQPLAIYKAALAGNEEWALTLKAAADRAGVTVLTYPVAKAQQKPFQTMAVGACKESVLRHGGEAMGAALQLIAASEGAEQPGFITSSLIRDWTRIMASRPGWVLNISRVTVPARRINLAVLGWMEAEARIEKAVGDGRRGDAEEEIRNRVKEARARKLTPQMIAAHLRMRYADVERIIAEVEA